MFPGKRSLLSTLILSSLLTACGGGGGGGGGGSSDDNRAAQPEPQPLTTLPVFLQSATDTCTVIENGETLSLLNYRGTLANISEVSCTNATLANLSEIEQLTALQALRVANAGLSNIDELLPLAGQLRTLDLGENALTDLASVGQLTALEYLDLSGMAISDISALANLLNLKTLDLANNDIADLAPLNALSQLQQVHLNGNTDLDCNAVQTFTQTLTGIDTDSEVTPPAHCTSALYLNADSPALQTVNNATSDPHYGSVFFGAGITLSDITLFKSGQNLTFTVATGETERSITFVDWYADSANRLNLFVFADGSQIQFYSLQDAVTQIESLTDGDDEFVGSNADDTVYGGEGNDFLRGNGGRDTLFGGPGNDILFGGSEGDTFIGGPGNDLLAAASVEFDAEGNVTTVGYDSSLDNRFIYSSGDGHDTIATRHSSAHSDILELTGDINADNIALSRMGNALKLTFDADNSITILNWFDGCNSSAGCRVGYIQLPGQDSVRFDTFIEGRTVTMIGTPEADTIRGSIGNDTIDGGAGNDQLEGDASDDQVLGGDGNDILRGGQGADVIEGGKGDDWIFGYGGFVNSDGTLSTNGDDRVTDIILYHRGDGNDIVVQRGSTGADLDILRFAADIAPADLTLTWSDFSLVLRLDEANSVTLYRHFGEYQFGSIQFGDNAPQTVNEFLVNKTVAFDTVTGSGQRSGTYGNDVMSGDASNNVLYGAWGTDLLYGGAGNDILLGGEDSDTLHGGPGDDMLIGAYASVSNGILGYTSNDGSADVYLFNLGDGNDLIVDSETGLANHGTVQFGPGIGVNDFTLSRSGYNLVMRLNESDSITIHRWFYGFNKPAFFQFSGMEPVDAVEFVNARLPQ